MKVLMVDDDADSLDMLTRLFRSYDICALDNGKDAVEEYAREYQDGNIYNAVFMDMKMPGMSGWEAAKKIREIDLKLETTIAAITGMETSELTAEEMRPFDAILMKPLPASLLLAICKHAGNK